MPTTKNPANAKPAQKVKPEIDPITLIKQRALARLDEKMTKWSFTSRIGKMSKHPELFFELAEESLGEEDVQLLMEICNDDLEKMSEIIQDIWECKKRSMGKQSGTAP